MAFQQLVFIIQALSLLVVFFIGVRTALSLEFRQVRFGYLASTTLFCLTLLLALFQGNSPALGFSVETVCSYSFLSLLLVLAQLLVLSLRPLEIARMRYWFVFANSFIFSVLSSFDLAAATPKLLSFLFLFYSGFSVLLSLGYISFIASLPNSVPGKRLKNFKMAYVFKHSVLGLVVSLLFVLFIPGLAAASYAGVVGDVWLASTFVSVSQTLARGELLYLDYLLDKSLRLPGMQNSSSAARASKFLDLADDWLQQSNPNEELILQLSARERDESTQGASLGSRILDLKSIDSLAEEKLSGMLAGVRQGNEHLRRENLQLQSFFTEEPKQSAIGFEPTLRRACNKNSSYLGSEYFDEYLSEVRVQSDSTTIISASHDFELTLKKAMLLANTSSSILFLGERGVGRGLLAEFVNDRRNVRNTIELNSKIELDRFSLREHVSNILSCDEPSALIVRNIESLESKDIAKLVPLIENKEGDKFIYMTASADYISTTKNLNYYSYYPVLGQTLTISPLRERPEDIYYQFIYFVDLISSELGGKIQRVSEDLLVQACQLELTRNSRELKHLVRSSILNCSSSYLDEFKLPSQ